MAAVAALAVPTTASARPTRPDPSPASSFSIRSPMGCSPHSRDAGRSVSFDPASARRRVTARRSPSSFAALRSRHARGRRALSAADRGGQENERSLLDVLPCASSSRCRGRAAHMVANNKLFRIAVIGIGDHGLLTSPRTRIPGLVSVFDVVPTTLPGANRRRRLWWTPERHAVERLASLDKQVAANNRLKFAALFILAGLILLLALFGLRAAVTAVPAALLVNLLLGVTQVSNEVLLIAAIAAGTALLAFALARLCRNDDALLLLFRRSRGALRGHHGCATGVAGDQSLRADAELAFLGRREPARDAFARPLLTGAVIAQRRFGLAGLPPLRLVRAPRDDRQPARRRRRRRDHSRRRPRGPRLAAFPPSAARSRGAPRVGGARSFSGSSPRGLAQPGPNHLRHAFFGNGLGLLKAVASLVPLSYLPALHALGDGRTAPPRVRGDLRRGVASRLREVRAVTCSSRSASDL